MTVDNGTALAVREESKALATPVSGRGYLAQLSNEEFTTKLEILKTERKRIQQVQREVMQADVDYGKVPGTDRVTLLKPGQEALCDMYSYRLETRAERAVGGGETAPHISWQVHTIVHLGSYDGPIMGDGWGSCNSWEKKYRWRAAGRTCPTCGKEGTIIESKNFQTKVPEGFLCWKKPEKGRDGCGAKFPLNDARITGQAVGQTENDNPWDLDNTILKMAEKRSKVDATLSVCAASGLFTQDMEDVDDAPAQPAAQPPTNGNSWAKPAVGTKAATKPTAAAAPGAQDGFVAPHEFRGATPAAACVECGAGKGHSIHARSGSPLAVEPAPVPDLADKYKDAPFEQRPVGALEESGKTWLAEQLKAIGYSSLAELNEFRGHAVQNAEIAGSLLEHAQTVWLERHPGADVTPPAPLEEEIQWPGDEPAEVPL